MNLTTKVVQLHTRMLNDRRRTSKLLDCIKQVVRPRDVVLDIGTGTGILSAAAARAGARRVYAIERGPIRNIAQNIFETNGLMDRITLVPGDSTSVELPERVDVLVSELIGNDPLAENVLEITLDAIKRFLKSNARFMPGGLKVFGLLANMPESARSKLIFTPDNLQEWQSLYGINFAPLGEVNRNSLQVFYLEPALLSNCKFLAPPALLANISFKTLKDPNIEHRRTITTVTSGVLNCLILYVELMLTPRHSLSTHPSLGDKDNHWLNPVYVLVNPKSLRVGGKIGLTYSYNAVARSTWIDVSW